MCSSASSTPAVPLALYVHIPFCETKCPYCDFNTYARIEPLMPAYVAALRREAEAWGAMLGRPAVRTVFFGGGTPSYLPPGDIAAILDTVRAAFAVERDAEVTLEANPGDFTPKKLASYLKAGVNRLSIGVQSLDDGLLSLLGRRHNAAQAVEAYRMARAAGLGNISLDLMFGLPRQSLAQWEASLRGAADLGPEHLSMYCLTLEAGTPMEHQVKTGLLPEPDADVAADMYLAAEEVMGSLGYRHYEISNWAKPGRESRHNLTYWRNEPYLGIGPGAHSYLAGLRFANLKPPREYVTRIEAIATPLRAEHLDVSAVRSIPVVDSVEAIGPRLEMAETMMMGLRLDTGISLTGFQRRFGTTLAHAYGSEIADLTADGLVEQGGGVLRITARGRLLGNRVFSRFFVDMAKAK
ncbi:MAG: radical SAM family heme chaperone HemW [SAR202 cluster bacterium]|nr:radical SAM family heme chaperone HemW [SAR202 cluster bacterium]